MSQEHTPAQREFSRHYDLEPDLSSRVAILETHMDRLVGPDGNGGLLERLDKHMEKMSVRAAGIEKKLMLFSFALIVVSGINALKSEAGLEILKSIVGIK